MNKTEIRIFEVEEDPMTEFRFKLLEPYQYYIRKDNEGDIIVQVIYEGDTWNIHTYETVSKALSIINEVSSEIKFFDKTDTQSLLDYFDIVRFKTYDPCVNASDWIFEYFINEKSNKILAVMAAAKRILEYQEIVENVYILKEKLNKIYETTKDEFLKKKCHLLLSIIWNQQKNLKSQLLKMADSPKQIDENERLFKENELRFNLSKALKGIGDINEFDMVMLIVMKEDFPDLEWD